MFKRKKQASATFHKFSNHFQTWLHHLILRLQDLKGTPSSIAAGFACGVGVTFTPFVGFHCIMAVIIAWFIRGNIIAAAIGTIAGNPWTFPFIWAAVLYTGRIILGLDHSGAEQVDFLHTFAQSFHALLSFDFSIFFHDIWPILWPMIIGSIPFFFLAWVVSYYLLKASLQKIGFYRLKKFERKADKLKLKR